MTCDERAAGPTGMLGTVMMSGPAANLSINLRRPQTPGKLIKTLRGTVEVSVSALRPNPIVIPLEGAAGKTFQNDDRRVVVKSIDTEPTKNQVVIEPTVSRRPGQSFLPPGTRRRPTTRDPNRDDGPKLRTPVRKRSVPVADPDPYIKTPVSHFTRYRSIVIPAA